MDTLDYGISSPQLAMMNNGQVFVAGQYEPPMNPPTVQTQSMASKLRAMDAGVPATITAGSSLFGAITIQPFIKVTLNPQGYYIAPTGGGSDVIPAISSPLMPSINAQLIGLGNANGYQVTWNPTFTYQMLSTAHPWILVDNTFAGVLGTGVQCPDLPNLTNGQARGGNLTLNASASLGVAGSNGYSVQAVPNKDISGANCILGISPSQVDALSALSIVDQTLTDGTLADTTTVFGHASNGAPSDNAALTDTSLTSFIRGIACQESGRQQFSPSNHYKNSINVMGHPVQSNDTGMGMMQITNTNRNVLSDSRRMQLLWDWNANIAEGISRFIQEPGYNYLASAYGYPNRVANTSGYAVANNNTKQAKGLAQDITVPLFTPIQLVECATRLYNGTGGLFDYFNLPLQEYCLSVYSDTSGNLYLDYEWGPDPNNPSRNIPWAIWQRVSGRERESMGQDGSNSYYVTGGQPLNTNIGYVTGVEGYIVNPCP
jgi:hypothetical protein